jgi:hypothetical protein
MGTEELLTVGKGDGEFDVEGVGDSVEGGQASNALSGRCPR